MIIILVMRIIIDSYFLNTKTRTSKLSVEAVKDAVLAISTHITRSFCLCMYNQMFNLNANLIDSC